MSSAAPPAAAIEIRGVSKRYVKYDDTPTLLGRTLRLTKRTKRSELWALRDIDFDVPRGSCVGVIGRNGSGKSTLLRMLAGVTAPTRGSVTVRGSVAPLISVGVGFHPELTGRENVFLNGMILGMSRSEVERRFDEILAFAEIGDFIDTPVKFYSSGMYVRLGFAVAVASSPDVLLVDEVLAVGDVAFQMKCFDRMHEIRESGTTIVVVSHNLNAVRRLCEQTAVLHNGELKRYSDTPSAIALIHELLEETRDLDDALAGPRRDHGQPASIGRIEVAGPDPDRRSYVASGDTVVFEIDLSTESAVAGAAVRFRIMNEKGMLVYSERLPLDRELAPEDGTRTIRVAARVNVPTGSYSAQALVQDGARRLVAPPAERSFFVQGRSGVKGMNDLAASIESDVAQPGP